MSLYSVIVMRIYKTYRIPLTGVVTNDQEPTMNRPDIGHKVTGTYHGQVFSGRVTYCRPHTQNTDLIYFVDLDSPIVVYGDERRQLCLTLDFDSLSSRFGDSLASA